jgi:Leucine-rich repeat (LRR) protein
LGIDSYIAWNHDNSFTFPFGDKETEKMCPFSVLPEEMSGLRSLRFLKLSNSKVEDLPDFLADLPRLEKIEIVNCNIKYISQSLQRLIDSGKLTLIKTEEGDDLSSFCNWLDKLL